MTSWHCGLQSAVRRVKNSTIGRPERGRGSGVIIVTRAHCLIEEHAK